MKQAVLFEDSFRKGEVTSAKAPKFEAFSEDWLRDIAPLWQNENTLSNNRRYAKRAYKSLFEHKRIDRITTEDIQAYVTELRTEDRSDT